jgi:hypothetical protein
MMVNDQNEGWNYMATWGKQSLSDDMLGMAIIYNTKYFKEITEDNESHVILFKPKNNELEYYFLGAWEQEPGGIKSKKEFLKYLDQFVKQLNNPPVIELSEVN